MENEKFRIKNRVTSMLVSVCLSLLKYYKCGQLSFLVFMGISIVLSFFNSNGYLVICSKTIWREALIICSL